MKFTRKLVALLLALSCMLSLTACGGGEPAAEQPKADPNALFQALLTKVTYDTELSDLGEAGALYLPDLPADAKVQMYAGSGYYADKVAMITLADASDAEAAMKSVKDHVAQLRTQFQSYIPEEVPKIDNALIWQQDNVVILCITGDYRNAQSIIDGAASLEAIPTQPSTEAPTQESTEAPTEDTTEPEETTEPTTEPPTEPPVEPYPELTSQSGTYAFHNPIYQVDNSAFEGFGYSESAAQGYADVVNMIAAELQGKVNVYALTIPTSVGITLPDDIQAIMKKYENQGEAFQKLFAKLEGVIPVDCYDALMHHRDEYIYFNTDHHWTARGAYYAYEAFCKAKGVTPYTLEERRVDEFTNFRGSLYQYMVTDGTVSDTVYAYHPYSKGVTMSFTDVSGNSYAWDVILDVSDYPPGMKYNTFAAGDQPYAEFHNPQVTDGSVCIVVKESYGCAFMPFIVDHYSTVYEIDYRYWKGSLTDFALEVGAQDLIFANNIMRICSGLVAGDLNRIA